MGSAEYVQRIPKDLDRGALRDSKYFYGPTQPRIYFIGVKFLIEIDSYFKI